MVKMGDLVKDKVSGFEGIIVSKHDYLNGCTRMSVQPKVDKDGKLPECQTFDKPQLKKIKSKVVKEGNRDIGGPGKYEDNGRM
jgi:hypothetical protein